MNLLKIIRNIKGFYKRIDLPEEYSVNIAEKLDEKNVSYKFAFEDGKLEGIQIYGNSISYNDLDSLIQNIKKDLK